VHMLQPKSEEEENKRTGSAVDSSSPQSRTRPVMRPTERSARRWLEANDMDGTWKGVSQGQGYVIGSRTWRFSKRILARISFT
jgi:hypothetical protein